MLLCATWGSNWVQNAQSPCKFFSTVTKVFENCEKNSKYVPILWFLAWVYVPLLKSWFTKYHVKMLSVKIQYQKFLVVVKSKSPRSCLRSLELSQSYLYQGAIYFLKLLLLNPKLLKLRKYLFQLVDHSAHLHKSTSARCVSVLYY